MTTGFRSLTIQAAWSFIQKGGSWIGRDIAHRRIWRVDHGKGAVIHPKSTVMDRVRYQQPTDSDGGR